MAWVSSSLGVSEASARTLVLLGARMARTRGPYQWRFPLFLPEGSANSGGLGGEVSGGSSRMRAIQAEFIVSCAPSGSHRILVLVTGGLERDGSSRAAEAARQLVMRYGLPRDAVVPIGGEGSTLGNSLATVEYLRGRVSGGVTGLEIVTNDYHMLRAWFIFSREMLLATTGRRLAVPAEDFARIKEIVTRGLPGPDEWSQARVRADRECVMSILQPHFSMSRVAIVPLVVEETLERSRLKPRVAARYASLLRGSRWARDTLRLEYARFVDLISESVAQ